MQSTSNREQSDSQTPHISSPPRARVILDFIEGDLSRPPIIYPVISDGSDEDDEAMRREILRRWDSAS